MVSSAWDEIENDEYKIYVDDANSINGVVNELDESYGQSPEEANNRFIERLGATNIAEYTNIVSNEGETIDVGGIPCTLFNFSYDWKNVEATTSEYIEGCYAYIPTAVGNYRIEFCYDNAEEIVRAILETITIQ